MILRLLAIGLVAAGAIRLGTLTTDEDDPPADDSADVGFARDMIRHHGQAVQLAELVRDRTDDPAIRTLALDISHTQQAQIGMMLGWLRLWDRRPTDIGSSRAWMGHPMSGSMPGMADDEDVERLTRLDGRPAEELFLRLMIPHHQGGVLMAEAGRDLAEVAAVRTLADTIAQSQTAEIDYLEQLLSDRGEQALVDEPPAMPAVSPTDDAAMPLEAVGRWWLVAVGAVALCCLLLDTIRIGRRERDGD